MSDQTETDHPRTAAPSIDSSGLVAVEVDAMDLASNPWELHRKILNKELPLPCWLSFGNCKYKITEDTCDAVALGMMINDDAKSAYFE